MEAVVRSTVGQNPAYFLRASDFALIDRGGGEHQPSALCERFAESEFGPLGFYNGVTPSLAFTVPPAAGYWLVYRPDMSPTDPITWVLPDPGP